MTDATCVLLVTRLDYNEKSVSRKAAYEWATELLRDVFLTSEKSFEGELKAVIPLRAVIDGFLFKFILLNVPDDLVFQVLIPGMLKRLCNVQRLDQQFAENDRKRAETRLQEVKKRIQDLGDVEKMESLLHKLSRMRGEGGPEEKQRKFANDAMEVMRTCYRIGASNLKEGKADEA